MLPSEKLLFTRAEAAEMLSLSVSTLDVAIARGMLRARRNGRRVTLEKREIERFSRADHPRIWDVSGKRGAVVAGRDCFDCAKRGGAVAPAVRFWKRLALCAACFEQRSAERAERNSRAENSRFMVAAGPEGTPAENSRFEAAGPETGGAAVTKVEGLGQPPRKIEAIA